MKVVGRRVVRDKIRDTKVSKITLFILSITTHTE